VTVNATSAGRGATTPPGQRDHCRATGLHGHSLNICIVRATIAEAVGTFFLILAISATATAAALGRAIVAGPYDSLTMPLVAGMVLAAIVASLGPVSGAHLNPAVTVALAMNRHFPWRYVPAYAAAQLAGAIAAALAAWGAYGPRARSVALLGATLPARGVGAGQTLGIEIVATCLLVTVIVGVATNPRAPAGIAPVAIGFALAAIVFEAGPLTGASVNPVRSLGPMIVTGRFTDWWCYILGPLAGGAIAVTLYERVFRPTTPPVPQARAEAEQTSPGREPAP